MKGKFLMISSWSRFYKFSEVYEFHGVFDKNGGSTRQVKAFNGVEGRPHSDGGFRLRSTVNGRLSFSDVPLTEPLVQVPCPLKLGDIGCYFIRITVGDNNWDYIGKSAELKKGISDRLRDHFIKLLGASEIGFSGTTQNYEKVRQELKTLYDLDTNSVEFFKNHVQVSFIKVKRPDAQVCTGCKNPLRLQYKEHVSKIEGMALAIYFKEFKNFPVLNSADETKGLTGFKELLKIN